MRRVGFRHRKRFHRGYSVGWHGARAALVMIVTLVGIPGSGQAVSWEQLRYPGQIKCVVASGQYVWIGGESGAWRFDTRTNYILPFQEEINIRGESIALGGRIVKDIAVDARGRIWFACWHEIKEGGGAGISLFDGVGWESFTEADGLASNDVLCISVDTSGRVWVGTAKGLSVYYEGLWTTYRTVNGLMRDDPVELYVDHLGRMWCGFWRGVNVLFRDQYTWTWERESVDYVYGIAQDEENKIYCATKGGFAVHDGIRWDRILNRGDLRRRVMSSVVADDAGNVWCAWGGLPKGVSVFDGQRWARVTKRNTDGGLASDRTVAIGKDTLGRLWFAARDGQVSVMMPDGAPGIGPEDAKTSSMWYMGDKQALLFQSPGMFRAGYAARGFLSRVTGGEGEIGGNHNLPFLRFPPLVAIRGANFIEWRRKERFPEREFPIPDLDWEDPVEEEITGGPVLIAQAATPSGIAVEATTQIQIVDPAGLVTATKEAPFSIDRLVLDMQGSVGTTEKIDKVEVNGFQADLQAGVSMGNLNFYSFKGSVVVEPGITIVRLELLKGEQAVFAREFPVTVAAKEPEKTPPEIYFIAPQVPPDEIIAVRSGRADKIRIQLSLQPRGEVRGIATDDTGVKEVKVNKETAFMTDPAPSQLREYNITKAEGAKYFEQTFELNTGPNVINVEAIDLFGNVAPLSLDLYVQELLSDSNFYTSSWAFIVGIDKYGEWPPLANAVRDAKGIYELLTTKLNFPRDHVFEVYNEQATLENISKAFEELSKAGERDRMVIFFACHGHTEPSGGRDHGFLVPADGAFVPSKKPSLQHIRSWISMEYLSQLIEFINAKHILLVVDACYSGLVTAKRGADLRGRTVLQDQVTARFLEWAEEQAIEVITAGGKDEQVADGGYRNHSVFTGFLIRGLETGEADLAKDGVITGKELGTYVMLKVMETTGNAQHPQYCKLPGYEDQEGTVLFVVPPQMM